MENIKEEQMIKALIDYPITTEEIDKIRDIKELKTIREIVIINYRKTLEITKTLRKS
jgi:ABC-type phosphate/phosphonate transport system substrate-binding protein